MTKGAAAKFSVKKHSQNIDNQLFKNKTCSLGIFVLNKIMKPIKSIINGKFKQFNPI
jgi:hypothetical protein